MIVGEKARDGQYFPHHGPTFLVMRVAHNADTLAVHLCQLPCFHARYYCPQYTDHYRGILRDHSAF